MSLILEALKKSEAERRAGEVPVLLGERTWVPKRQRPVWPVFVLFVAVVGVAALVANRSILWPERFPVAAEPEPSNRRTNPDGAVALLPERDPGAPSTARKPVEITETAPPAHPPTDGPAAEPVAHTPDPAASTMMPPPVSVPAPVLAPATAFVSDPPATFQTPPGPIDAPPTDVAALEAPVASTPAGSTPPVETPITTPEIAARDPAATHAPAAPPPAEPTLLLFAELPYATRQAMPAMKISMQVYHQDPSRRFIIVNGARLQEGGVIGTELKLSDIRPDGIVLEFRGERFLILRAGG